jgi:hypothetical protein
MVFDNAYEQERMDEDLRRAIDEMKYCVNRLDSVVLLD